MTITKEFLADPLEKKAEPPTQQEEPIIEQDGVNDLEKMKEDLIKLQAQAEEVSDSKEELLPEVIEHDVAVSEAEAGKKKLPTMIPIKTIRLNIYGFNAFENKKFYKVKLDYDLFIEVNADSPIAAMAKVREFGKVILKGMGEIEEVEINEFMPQNCGINRIEKQEF